MKVLKLIVFIFLLPAYPKVFAQAPELYKKIYETYPSYKADGFETRRFKHSVVKERLKEIARNSIFKLQQVGRSIEGRELYLISAGTGETNVFLWSQMHGDESTATMAIFDILNFLKSNDFKAEKQELLSNVTLHFLPMLNPDGAEKYQRRNSLGVDINRDALRLQSPESKTLKRIRDSLAADFGFNLHDQSRYYNVGLTGEPATISFLAPAYNQEKSVNEVRSNALKVIVEMNKLLQEFIPGRVGRYDDTFEPRAFGDNIQKWGTSTILIESGGYPGDPEKQEIRRLNYSIILASLFSISSQSYLENSIAFYDSIPENERMLVDLKITGMAYKLKGKEYLLDLGINRNEVDLPGKNQFYYKSEVVDRGDLRTSFGYEEFDAARCKFVSPQIFPTAYTMEEVANLNFKNLLKQGYGYIKVKDLPASKKFVDFPINLVSLAYKVPKGITSSFFLEKNGVIEYAVINGFLINLNAEDPRIKNSLILR